MDDVKLILINEEKIYKLKSLEELVEVFLGNEYKNQSYEEKYFARFNKAFQITVETNTELVDTRVGKINGEANVVSESFSFSNAFIIDNEKTFILSTIKLKNMLLLEKKDEKIFYIDGLIKDFEEKDSIDENNYIQINKFIDKLLLLNMKLD